VIEPRADEIRAILLDVEGTTTPISFVYQTLIPYARANLRAYLARHNSQADIQSLLERLRQEQQPDAGDRPSLVEVIESLMDHDRKSTPLKELQGLIWQEGYQRKELSGEVFPDVPAAFERWSGAGIGLGIFSSGSVLAQQLLFQHSTAGDLTIWLRWHFDTTVGSKRDVASYRRIGEVMAIPAGAILFVSDVIEELDAARAAGMQTRLSERPGNSPVAAGHTHVVVERFDDLRLAEDRP